MADSLLFLDVIATNLPPRNDTIYSPWLPYKLLRRSLYLLETFINLSNKEESNPVTVLNGSYNIVDILLFHLEE